MSGLLNGDLFRSFSSSFPWSFPGPRRTVLSWPWGTWSCSRSPWRSMSTLRSTSPWGTSRWSVKCWTFAPSGRCMIPCLSPVADDDWFPLFATATTWSPKVKFVSALLLCIFQELTGWVPTALYSLGLSCSTHARASWREGPERYGW